ncbi:hypothetical protein J2T12_001935 [Paenibacillus anaericanus]|uniref:hypothetical protein n=1 Tax=Paenibacillus anaericanus TaxID=170367 RepID=UPI002788AFA7|nr:hypothetical protein [Paenibacillus anaericanus]MDQ0088529.1 hypothetical protein [Paenibacillus anaericanus]
MSFYNNYPLNSNQDIFSRHSTGRYFVYLSNRSKCLSYLANKIEDFDYNNDELYKAMPMGYTTLTILERAFLIDGEGIKTWPVENEGKIYIIRNEMVPKHYWGQDQKEYHLLLESFKGTYALNNATKWCEDLLIKISNEESNSNVSKLIGAVVVEEFNWH